MTSTRIFSSSLLASSVFALLAASSSTAAAQHDVRVFLAESGVDFVAEQIPSYIPSVLQPPNFTRSYACMDFEQRDTMIQLNVENVQIDMPSVGRLRLAFDFSGRATGELYADDIYACLGEATCQDSMTVDRASAVLGFDVDVVEGEAQVRSRDVELHLADDDFDFELSDCGMTGSALTTAIGFAEGYLIDYLRDTLVSTADQSLAPMLEEMIEGMTMDAAYVSASIEDLYFPNKGLELDLNVGLHSNQEAAACVAAYDQGPPARVSGDAVPTLSSTTNDLNLALNLGLVNQALYVAWQRGLLCINNEVLYALGTDVDLDAAGAMLPGFPVGTEFAIDVRMTEQPRVRGMSGDGVNLVAEIPGIQVLLHGDRPDGTRNTLRVEASLEAQAELIVNPATNAIYARIKGAEIRHLRMSDEREATGEGYDVARIKQLVHDRVIPKVLGALPPVPVTGAVYGVSDYALLLRSMDGNNAYLSAAIDLFRVPANDQSAPNTTIDAAPAGMVNPHTARIVVGGSDDQIPQELLQYQITVDGVQRPLSFVRDFLVGEAGYTKSYEVSVAAVDLAGNVDSSPATASVLVDGVTPFVVIEGSRIRNADEGALRVQWSMRDDQTSTSALAVVVQVYKLDDPTDALSTRLVQTQNLPVGSTETMVELEGSGGIYRVEVHVGDEAGNDSQSSLLLDLSSTGGCSVGGQSGGNAIFLLLTLGALLSRRRRVQVKQS